MESFPILAEEARRWFAVASFEVKGNWDDLMKKFCKRFFLLSKVQHIRKQVIHFAQGEKEGIDQACDRFNGLNEQRLKLGFSGDVLLHTFYFSLTPECMQFVQMCAGGDLIHTHTHTRQRYSTPNQPNTHPANQPIHNSTTPTRPPHLSSFFVREHEP